MADGTKRQRGGGRAGKSARRGAEVIDTEEIKRSAIVDYVAGRRPSIPESWLSPERLAALRADGRISDQDQKKLGVMYG